MRVRPGDSAKATVVAALFAMSSIDARGAQLHATPDDYVDKVKALRPGDELRLSPGDYLRGLSIIGLSGTAAAPIRIVADQPRSRPRFIARSGRNLVSIVDSGHVEVHGFDLDGRGLEVDAVKAEGHARYAHDISISGMRIRNFSRDQQTVGISTKCPTWGWRIEGNDIAGVGTGMYFGSSDGSAPFIGGVIAGNLIVDTTGYNLQIKHQSARPTLPGMPTTTQRTIIRDNVLAKGETSSRGELARPNLLVGHFPLASTGADDEYLIYGNFVYGNPTEALVQAEGNVSIYNNVLVNPQGDALAIQPHNDRPRRVRVFGNTIVAAGAGIRVSGLEPDAVATLVGNAVFANPPFAGREPGDNVIGALGDAQRNLRHPYGLPGSSLDVTPSRRLARYKRARFADLPGADATFDALPRRRGDAGAYEWSTSQSPWKLALEIKPSQRTE